MLVLRQFVADREKANAEIQSATNGNGDEEPATKRRKVAENDQVKILKKPFSLMNDIENTRG